MDRPIGTGYEFAQNSSKNGRNESTRKRFGSFFISAPFTYLPSNASPTAPVYPFFKFRPFFSPGSNLLCSSQFCVGAVTDIQSRLFGLDFLFGACFTPCVVDCHLLWSRGRGFEGKWSCLGVSHCSSTTCQVAHICGATSLDHQVWTGWSSPHGQRSHPPPSAGTYVHICTFYTRYGWICLKQR